MAEYTVSVRDEELASTLKRIAERDWRTEQQQVCALLEQALRTERARANSDHRPRARRTPGVPRTNGVARVEA